MTQPRPAHVLQLTLLLAALLSAGCFQAARAPKSAAKTYDPQPLATVLQDAVRDGGVDYAQVRAQQEHLERYLAMVGRAGPSRQPQLFPTDADRIAFHLNAYHAIVLRKWLDYGAGGDRRKRHSVEAAWYVVDLWPVDGRSISLHDLEHQRLRKDLGDARVVFALCRGRRDDPPLRAEPYAPTKLDDQLNEQVRAFLASDRWQLVDGTLQVPSGFEPWKDSMDSVGGWAGVFERYLPPSHPRRLDAIRAAVAGRIAFQSPDPTINAAP